jgi:hypothetical protein
VFGSAEKTYTGKNICVTGLGKNHKDTPEIIAEKPFQITLAQQEFGMTHELT